MKKRIKTGLSALLAGAFIAFGGTVYLSLESKVAGALFFTVGLFAICSFGLHLFTGKVCYLLQRDRAFALDLPLIWLGNLLGTGAVAALLKLTRLAPALTGRAAALCDAKTSDSLLSLFILAVFCNVFIYLAVEGYAVLEHPGGKYLALFFGVTVFILSGFEHCVADMFYFWMSGWSGGAVPALLVITAGNALGGVAAAQLRKLVQ